MATQTQFTINGVIDTGQSILSNLELLASAAGSWLTYDVTIGKWAFVINSTGSSIKSFSDSNIIGAINVSSTGITELYNSVEIDFPHRDLKDARDYITFVIDSNELYPNEPDNRLKISFDIVNNPVQAQLLASRELKQSRVDKVIEFRTDYTSIGLKAGDLIDITSTMYGFTSKVFRIISIQEVDEEDGTLSLSIRALEYDSNVYDTTGLTYSARTIDNGIITKDANTATKRSDNEAVGFDLSNALLGLGGVALLNALLKGFASGDRNLGQPGLTPLIFTADVPTIEITTTSSLASIVEAIYNTGYTVNAPYSGYYKVDYLVNWGGVGGNPPPIIGCLKNSRISIFINGIEQATDPNRGTASTGDAWSPLFEDQSLSAFVYANQNDIIEFKIGLSTNWPTYYASDVATFAPGYPSFTPAGNDRASVFLNIELFYVGS